MQRNVSLWPNQWISWYTRWIDSAKNKRTDSNNWFALQGRWFHLHCWMSNIGCKFAFTDINPLIVSLCPAVVVFVMLSMILAFDYVDLFSLIVLWSLLNFDWWTQRCIWLVETCSACLRGLILEDVELFVHTFIFLLNLFWTHVTLTHDVVFVSPPRLCFLYLISTLDYRGLWYCRRQTERYHYIWHINSNWKGFCWRHSTVTRHDDL